MVGKELGLFQGATTPAQQQAIVQKYMWAPTLAKDLRAKGKSITDPSQIEAATRSKTGVKVIVLNDTYAGTEDHIMIQVGEKFYEMRSGRRKATALNGSAFSRSYGNITMGEVTKAEHINNATAVRKKHGNPDWAKTFIKNGTFKPYVKEVIDISKYYA